MNQERPLKIKRIPKKSLEIDDFTKFRQAFKKHYTNIQSISLNLNDRGKFRDYYEFEDIKYAITKLLDKLPRAKCLRKLDLQNAFFPLYGKGNSKLPKQVKQNQHLRELILPSRYEDDLVLSFKSSTLWLKHGKNFKRLDFWVPRYSMSSYEKELDLFYKHFEASRLNSFTIAPGHPYSDIPEELLDFSRYPKTLTKFTILNYDDEYEEKEVNSCIEFPSNLSNLKSIKIETSSEDINSTLVSISKLKKLRHIDLFIPDIHPHCVDLFDNLPDLEHLCLNLTPNSLTDEFIKRIGEKHKKLKTFSLTISREIMQTLQECLANLKELETLELYFSPVNDWNKANNLSFLHSLPELLLKLRNIKEFRLETYGSIKSQLNYLSLTNSLKKLPYLEKITIDSRLYLPDFFLEIIRCCKEIPSLQVVNIDTNQDIFLLKSSCDDLCKLIDSLENLRVLKLPGLMISNKIFLEKITESILKKKYLTDFTIGQILKIIPPEVLMHYLFQILSKKGLRRFKFEIKKRKGDLMRGPHGYQRLTEIFRMIQRNNPDIELFQLLEDITEVWHERFTWNWKDEMTKFLDDE